MCTMEEESTATDSPAWFRWRIFSASKPTKVFYPSDSTLDPHWCNQSHSFFNLPNPILGAYSSTLAAPKSYTE